MKAAVHVVFEDNNNLVITTENGERISGRMLNRMAHQVKRKISGDRSRIVHERRKEERAALQALQAEHEADVEIEEVQAEGELIEAPDAGAIDLPDPDSDSAESTDWLGSDESEEEKPAE